MLRFLVIGLFYKGVLLYALSLEEINDPCNEWMDHLIRQQFCLLNHELFSRKNIQRAFEEQQEFVFRFQIKNNRYIGPASATKNVIDVLAEGLPLPDLDALYFNANGPTSMVQLPLTKVPLLAGSKHRDMQYVILFHHPYFCPDQDGQYVEEKILQEVESLSEFPWEQREERLFWRGSNSGMELYTLQNWMKLYRGRLVYLSSLYPELINAKFCHLLPFKCENREELIKLISLSAYPSTEEYARYKYQMIMKGDTAAYYSFIKKLALGSLVFKPDNPIIMWFYDALIPFVHFIPLRDSLSDLTLQLKRARLQDSEMRQIAENGKEFARHHLHSKDLLIYCYKVLCYYAKMQKEANL